MYKVIFPNKVTIKVLGIRTQISLEKGAFFRLPWWEREMVPVILLLVLSIDWVSKLFLGGVEVGDYLRAFSNGLPL